MPENTFSTTLIKKTPVIGELVNAARTIEDDPGHHKLKALSAGAVTAGLSIYGANKLKEAIPAVMRGNNKIGIMRALTAFALPAGIYYAVKNRDSNSKIALGLGTAVGGTVLHNKTLLAQPTVNAPNIKGALPYLGALGSATYMLDELGKIKNNEGRGISSKYPVINNLPHVDKITRLRNLRNSNT